MAQGVGPQHGRDERARRAWALPVSLAVAVVVVAGVVVGVVLGRSGGTEDAAVPVVATVPGHVPTPTVTPSPRSSTTAFTALLPASVLQYALTASAPATDWQTAGALEAWSDTYSDGGSGTVTVQAGQWPDTASATAFAATLTATLPTAAASTDASASGPATGAGSAAPSAGGAPGSSASASAGPTTSPALPQSGKVTVAGATTGSYTVVAGPDGTGVAVWTNGTAVFRLVAPLADVLNAYAAYPL